MKTLATMIVEYLIFFSRSEDDELDPDTAVKLLEFAGSDLRECSEAEKLAMLEVIREKKEAALKEGDTQVAEIMDEIVYNVWRDEEDGEEELS